MYFSSNAFITSTGIADPPEQQKRRVVGWCLAASGWCSIAKYMVGTPEKRDWYAHNKQHQVADMETAGVAEVVLGKAEAPLKALGRKKPKEPT